MKDTESAAASAEVRDDRENHRYVIEVDGKRAGMAVYHFKGGRHFFVHTEIDPAFSGSGMGTTLVRAALDDVRSRGGIVVPICPFFASFIERHPDYQDLVDRDIMDRVERARDDSTS